MAKKRKSDANRLDEVERGMYSTFCSAANSLSQIYTQAMNQQKVSFQAGERHALEKLYQWILRQHEETSRVTAADIVAYLQHEIDYGGEDSSISPRYQASASFAQATSAGLGHRAAHIDQTKNSVFSNALSSPVRRSLQSYHLPQGGGESYPDAGNGSRNHESNSFNQNKDPNSNDSSMDMHSDSPSHDSY
ncbi:uncharacterized protein A4U43_C01F22180 [Asparagus officinalis]|uniref:Holocarboxylase synthetase n=1 Tax=Asparagus officinalis TaxID=4686 RepID=A0A5P1FS23_ASPOF|nr:uncharacterized protein LOC109827379 [Asparagus officinalis]ONK80824.1 uncharacterized protein A4U43_C01F22180 [Asparagus officinalis]